MAAVTLDSRPRLAASVTFEPSGDEGRWIVCADDVPVSRVSPGVVDLLRSLDGQRSLRTIAAAHDDVPSAALVALMDRFAASGLLAGEERRPPGRFAYLPPLTLQFATLRAPQVFAALDRPRRALLRRWMLLPLAAVIVLGLLALVAQASAALTVVTAPLPVASFWAVAGVLVLATLVHEAAHGMTLAGHGVLPRRAGMMLFYLSPAFFVDVTNGWRLAERRARVAVALAGPGVHATVGSAAALVAVFAADDRWRDGLLVLALAAWAVVAVNLIPFVRFDGYLALMSVLDIPNLRSAAIADARDALARGVIGVPRPSRRVPGWWVVPFGVLSIATPILLVVFALDRILRAVSAGGAVGAVTVLAVETVVGVVLLVVVWRGARWLRSRGVGVVRLGATFLVAAVVVGLVGAVVPARVLTPVGFVRDTDDVRLVTDGAWTPAVGDRVLLSTQGLLGRRPLAEGTIDGLLDERTDIPVTALFPFEAPLSVDGRAIGTVTLSDPAVLPAAGSAQIVRHDTNAWGALWQSLVVSPLGVLGIALG